MTSQQKPTWIGLRVEDCIVDEFVAEGSFSWVYAGNTIDSGDRKAFKWAKQADFVERVTEEVPEKTQAKAFFTGGVRNVRPDAEKMLAWQAKKLTKTTDPALVPIEKLVLNEGLTYCQMPFISGPTLRHEISEGFVRIDVFIELALALQRLSKAPDFLFHGDVKPDNVIVSPKGLKLIDPGYFGSIDSAEGPFMNAAITTTCYYPYLRPDDIMAVGITMWEAACGSNPFLRDKNAGFDRVDYEGNLVVQDNITPAIRALVRQHEGVGHFFLQPLLTIRRPRELDQAITPELEAFLLKSLRLRVDGRGVIDVGPGFASFDAFIQAMQQLKKEGVHDL